MTTDKKIILNTFYQMAGKVSTSVIGVISFAFLARYLQNQLGEYVLISSFVGFIVVFADLGLGTLLTREIASKRADEKYISFIFTLRLLLAVFVTIIGSIAIFFFPYSIEVKIGVCLLAIANIFFILAATVWSIFQAELRFEKIVFAQVISSVITCILTIAFVLLKLPLLYFVLASSIGISICFIATYLSYAKTISLKIDKKAFLKILKEAWPIGAGVIISVIYFKIDALILPFYYNPSTHPDLSYYSTAYKIFEVAITFGGFYTGTLFPVFSAHLQSKNFILHFKKHLTFTILLGVAGCSTLFIFAKLFIFILAGEGFYPATLALQILSFAAVSSILSGFFLNIAIAGGKQLLLLKYSFIAAVLNICLNLLIIPKYSFIGASWTTVVTQLLILIMNIYVAILVIKERRSTRTL
jgi:O-antigen/teichoic acid export membrane protein